MTKRQLGEWWWYCRRCRRRQLVNRKLRTNERPRCDECAQSCHWQAKPAKSERKADSYQPSLFS